MHDNLVLFIFPLFVILFIIIAAYGAIQERRRRVEISAWAKLRGLQFDASHYSALDSNWPLFRCLQEGDNRYAYNIAAGDWSGRLLMAFDYHYETHSTDSKGRRQTHHHHFSAAILESPVALKPLLIRPEGFLDKIGEFFGHDDIDFESADFSKKFFVKAEDRKWAYDVLHTRAMEFLLGRPQYMIQFEPRGVIVWKNARWPVAEIMTAVETVQGLLDGMPEYLVQELKSGGEVNA
ncbi:hypothetical protein LLG95_08025 [bacterium]|nr:hypothetical protein [bacterium]